MYVDGIKLAQWSTVSPSNSVVIVLILYMRVYMDSVAFSYNLIIKFRQ